MKNCKLSIIMSFQLCCNKNHRLVQTKEVEKNYQNDLENKHYE